jgi:hypothetical protein
MKDQEKLSKSNPKATVPVLTKNKRKLEVKRYQHGELDPQSLQPK